MNKKALCWALATSLFAYGCGQPSVESFVKTYKPTVQHKQVNFPAKTLDDYSTEDIWYYRSDAVEGEARRNEPTVRAVSRLEDIAKKDDDPRIRKLAYQMIESYRGRGDFSATEPYREFQDEKRRLDIKTTVDFGYDSRDVWYCRLEAVKNLKNDKDLPAEVIDDLRSIAENDDDRRIRDLAKKLIRGEKLEDR